MARKSDYFGLSYLVSVILAIIPVTAFVCGFITRILDGKILAAILRLVLGWNIIWLIDLILMIVSKHILASSPFNGHTLNQKHGTAVPCFFCFVSEARMRRGRRAAYAPPRKDHCSFCARRMHSSCPLISFSPSARTAGRYTPSSQRCIAFTLSESMSSR